MIDGKPKLTPDLVFSGVEVIERQEKDKASDIDLALDVYICSCNGVAAMGLTGCGRASDGLVRLLEVVLEAVLKQVLVEVKLTVELAKVVTEVVVPREVLMVVEVVVPREALTAVVVILDEILEEVVAVVVANLEWRRTWRCWRYRRIF
jgi:hypothetical protein